MRGSLSTVSLHEIWINRNGNLEIYLLRPKIILPETTSRSTFNCSFAISGRQTPTGNHDNRKMDGGQRKQLVPTIFYIFFYKSSINLKCYQSLEHFEKYYFVISGFRVVVFEIFDLGTEYQGNGKRC